MDVVADLPADAESAEPVQQRDTLLDHPPMYAQPRTVLNTAPGDDRPASTARTCFRYLSWS